jgi:hypothetical protein
VEEEEEEERGLIVDLKRGFLRTNQAAYYDIANYIGLPGCALSVTTR